MDLTKLNYLKFSGIINHTEISLRTVVCKPGTLSQHALINVAYLTCVIKYPTTDLDYQTVLRYSAAVMFELYLLHCCTAMGDLSSLTLILDT